MIEFAIRSIFSQSMTPLRLMPVLGVGLVAIAMAALVGLTVNSLVNGVPFPGFGTILAVVIMMFGVLFCFLSIIGIYVGLIFEQVRQRPHYVIDHVWGAKEGTAPASRAVAARTEPLKRAHPEPAQPSPPTRVDDRA